jgi:uncharacterized protein (DUF1697 family)
VAFLRGINLGKRRPPMSQLKALFEEIGFGDVATFIASGNVVFSNRAADRAKLEHKISQHLKGALGYDVESFVRGAKEVVAIGASTPFTDEISGTTTVHACLLHEPLPASDAAKLSKVQTPVDAFAVSGREFYWLCRTKINESAVWKDERLRAIRLPSFTMRNMTSIRKLIAQHLT